MKHSTLMHVFGAGLWTTIRDPATARTTYACHCLTCVAERDAARARCQQKIASRLSARFAGSVR